MLVLAMEFSRDIRRDKRRSLETEQEQSDILSQSPARGYLTNYSGIQPTPGCEDMPSNQ